MPRVALVTCQMFPDLYKDDFPVRDGLREQGVEVDAVCWDDEKADWSRYDLAVIRSPWDYVPRRDDFVAWAHAVPRLLNPADIIEWNSDKRYLQELAAAGLPITPTAYIAPTDTWTPPDSGEWVVKPTISVASRDSGRYRLPDQKDLAQAHVRRLQEAGRTAMIQPYLAAVDTAGETSILCTPTFSHAIRKGAMLSGPDTGKPHSEYTEEIEPRIPAPAERELADATLAQIPGGADRLLYARVDMIPGPDGAPLLVELELIEPSLFFYTSPGAAQRFTNAITTRL